jgi:hypothetical protein
MLIVSLLISLAHAECDEAFRTNALLANLLAVEQALRDGDSQIATEHAVGLRDGLPCMTELLPRAMSARVYRAIGGGLWMSGNEDRAMAWMRTAADLDPVFRYGVEDLDPDHPLHLQLSLAGESAGDLAFDPRPFGGGSHHLDGAKVDQAEARVDGPHLYQLTIDGGRRGWVIDQGTFPDEAFAVAAVTATDKRSKPEVDDRVVSKGNIWPAERVVLLAGGSTLLAGSGLLHALGASSRKRYDRATKLNDLDKTRSTTNGLVIGSIATLAAGVGTTGFGALYFVVDGGGGAVSLRLPL